MDNTLSNIVTDINNKIERLNKEKVEINFILNANTVLEDNLGDYLFEVRSKINELLTYVDIKIEICELKKQKYENELHKKNYSNWLSYIENKKHHINSISEILENCDLFSITELDDIDLTDTETVNSFYDDTINNKKED